MGPHLRSGMQTGNHGWRSANTAVSARNSSPGETSFCVQPKDGRITFRTGAIQPSDNRAVVVGAVRDRSAAGLLTDRPRRGRPRRISDNQEAAIVEPDPYPSEACYSPERAHAGDQPEGQPVQGASPLEETQTPTAWDPIGTNFTNRRLVHLGIQH
jgi:hypothetical protein